METYSFSESFINDLTEADLKHFYDKKNEVTEVLKSEKYVEFVLDITDPKAPKKLATNETDYEGFKKAASKPKLYGSYCGNSMGYTCIDEGWVKLETWNYKYGSTGEVSARFEWQKEPFYTLTDVLGIALNSNFSPIPGTESGVYKVDTYEGATVEKHFHTTHTSGSGGYGFRMELLGGSYYHNSRGYIKYGYAPNNSVATRSDAYAAYAHQETMWSVTPSFSFAPGIGISISNKEKFDFAYSHAWIYW
ncbi:hypothetical protein P7H06_09195 [Paenibacillus larvae]|nr:hypothetical protein [Paenibacillus larvae]MDT2259658.1 hypothetical protein [Paenibacillus larvae]